MILKGYIGTVYVRIGETSRIDIWRSDVWMKQDDVTSEMLEKKLEILNSLVSDSEDYGAYNWEEGEADPENAIYFEMFEKMIADVQSKLDGEYFDYSYEDVEITISSRSIHIPQLTEYEWAQICESKPL